MIGQNISHSKILSKLGEGAIGLVYKARDLKLDRCRAEVRSPDLTRDYEASCLTSIGLPLDTLQDPVDPDPADSEMTGELGLGRERALGYHSAVDLLKSGVVDPLPGLRNRGREAHQPSLLETLDVLIGEPQQLR